MNNNQGPRKLNRFVAYLPGFIKFYSIKNEYVTPVVFIVLLGIYFGMNLLMPNMDKLADLANLNTQNYEDYFKVIHSLINTMSVVYLMYAVISFLTRFVSSIYLNSFVHDLKGEAYFFKDILSTSFRKSMSILLTSIEFYASILLGILALFVPKMSIYVVALLTPVIIPALVGWVYLKLIFIFTNCFILDKGKGFTESIRSSINLTSGNKGGIFILVMVFTLVADVSTIFIGSLFSPMNNALALMFVAAFLSTIVKLMQARLIAQMYVDLEYGQVIKEEEF